MRPCTPLLQRCCHAALRLSLTGLGDSTLQSPSRKPEVSVAYYVLTPPVWREAHLSDCTGRAKSCRPSTEFRLSVCTTDRHAASAAHSSRTPHLHKNNDCCTIALHRLLCGWHCAAELDKSRHRIYSLCLNAGSSTAIANPHTQLRPDVRLGNRVRSAIGTGTYL